MTGAPAKRKILSEAVYYFADLKEQVPILSGMDFSYHSLQGRLDITAQSMQKIRQDIPAVMLILWDKAK